MKFPLVALVVFIMVMFLWLLSLLGAIGLGGGYSSWLPWFACLCLGSVCFYWYNNHP